MSLKKLLGLEAFPIKDSEIMQKILEAKRNNIEMIEFSSETKKVRINITKLCPDGLMKGYQDYYSAK